MLDAPTVGASISDIARQYLRQREEVDEAKKIQTEAQKRLDQTEGVLIAKLDELGLKSVKLDGNGSSDFTITAAEKTDYRLPAQEDPSYDLSIEWLLGHGGESLIKQTVHWASFSGFCHEQKREGKELPPGVKENTRRVVSVRKA